MSFGTLGVIVLREVRHPVPAHQISSTKASKPLTKTQKLAKALKQCKKDKSKRKQVACEADSEEIRVDGQETQSAPSMMSRR
ncbi:MAG: hypothetical protein ACRDK2_10295 [Solirubrobacteraceae bacterium]